jgi:hypothetical protein
MRRVGRDVGGPAGTDDRGLSPEGDLELAVGDVEHLVEVVAVRRWPAAGGTSMSISA